MTLGKLPQIRPGSPADLGIDGDRWHCGEERLKNSVLLLASCVPKLRNGHGRAEERRRSPAQAVPLRENARAGSLDLSKGRLQQAFPCTLRITGLSLLLMRT